jgi:YVTN family beta-propeller protein
MSFEVPVGQGPRMLAYDPIHHYVFVSNYGDNSVSVIKEGEREVFTTIRDPSFNYPFGIAFNPSNGFVYVTNPGVYPEGGNIVSVIDTPDVTPQVFTTIKVGNGPHGIAYHEYDHNMYVVNYISASVSVIDSSTNTVGSNVYLGYLPYYIAYNPLNELMYVPNFLSGMPPCPTPSTCQEPPTVDVIKPSGIVKRIPVDRLSNNIAFNPKNKKMYVITNQDYYFPNEMGRILVIDADPSSASYQTVVNTIESNEFGRSMQGIAYNPVTKSIYVTIDANVNYGKLAEIDIDDNITQFIPVGNGPWGVGLALDGILYVANQLSSTVSRLKLT